MSLRRAVHRILFPAAIVLPLAVLVVRGIRADSAGGVLAVFVAAGFLFVGLAATATLTALRKRVRESRAVSWADVAALAATTVAVVAACVWSSPIAAVAVAVVVLGWFWLSVVELVTETRARVRSFVDGVAPAVRPTSDGPQSGRVIVIEQGRSRS